MSTNDQGMTCVEKLAIVIAGLHQIASWDEGPRVTSAFDEPSSAGSARNALAMIGIDGPPPKVAPARPPVVIRSNAKGTVNRAQLRKLIEAGRVEARLDYSYDDMTGSQVGKEWRPSAMAVGNRPPRAAEGTIVFDDSDFESSSGRAYLRESNAVPGKQLVILRIHSNLIYELRVAS